MGNMYTLWEEKGRKVCQNCFGLPTEKVSSKRKKCTPPPPPPPTTQCPLDFKFDCHYIFVDWFSQLFFFLNKGLTLVLLNPGIPAFENSVDPDLLASEEADWSGAALFVFSMWIFILDKAIWLADNKKWVWHLNLFSMKRVNISACLHRRQYAWTL